MIEAANRLSSGVDSCPLIALAGKGSLRTYCIRYANCVFLLIRVTRSSECTTPAGLTYARVLEVSVGAFTVPWRAMPFLVMVTRWYLFSSFSYPFFSSSYLSCVDHHACLFFYSVFFFFFFPGSFHTYFKKKTPPEYDRIEIIVYIKEDHRGILSKPLPPPYP